MRLPILVLVAASAACAQPFSLGLKLGAPLTDFVNAVSSPNAPASVASTINNRYVVGPMVELRLPFGLGIEFDALFRHYSFSVPIENVSSNAWEFPLLAKYRFKVPVARPYIEAGVAWDKLQGVSEAFKVVNVAASTAVRNDVTRGFVMGAGLDIHALLIHISPEVRYTRWGAQHFLDPSNLVNSNQNQAEFLVGFSF